MSRMFSWLKRRPKKTSQVVRFKETERIVTETVFVPQQPVIEPVEAEVIDVEATTAVMDEPKAIRPPETAAEVGEPTKMDRESRSIGADLAVPKNLQINGQIDFSPAVYDRGQFNAVNREIPDNSYSTEWEAGYNRQAILDLLNEKLDGYLPNRVYSLIRATRRIEHLLALLENENWHTEYRAIRARVHVSDESIHRAYKELGID